MNRRTAEAQGLIFTGHYDRWYNKDKIKNVAAVIRKLYKCRVVMVEVEGGVSFYADEKYRAIEGIRDERRYITRETEEMQRAREAYEKKIAEIASRVNCARVYIEAQEAKYPELKGQTFPEIYSYMRENNIPF